MRGTPPLLLLAALLLAACRSRVPPDPYAQALRIRLEPRAAGEWQGLHNVYRLSDRIITGSEPQGAAAMRRLNAMGVRTILSVDGKVPDRALAARFTMRYVHVPIHYSGIGRDEALRICKTFRELPGPFYVHCFHGKHRGPAAAALGRLVLDAIPRDRALAEMRQWCKTSGKYAGLYKAIATLELPAESETRAYRWDFPAAHRFGGFREAMIEISRIHDNLKHLAARGWQPDPAHPDLDAANQSRKLAELFAGAQELPEVQARPADFRALLDTAADLSASMRQNRPSPEGLRRLEKTCGACHAAYRNS